MQKRKVLFINDSLWSGSGVFRSMLQILKHIAYEKYDVTLFIIPDGPVEQAMCEQIPPEVNLVIGRDDRHYYRSPKVAVCYLASKTASALHMKKTAKLLRRKTRGIIRKKRNRTPAETYFASERFDVLIANTIPCCSPVGRYIRADKKYVVYHSSRADFFPEETKEAFAYYDGVIAVSEGVRRILEEAYPENRDRIETITNYVDAEDLLRKAAEQDGPPSSNLPVLCTCGRISHEKGFDLAVEAAWILKEKGFSFIWYFVGDGSERPRIENMIEKYGLSEDIRITGFLPNPYPYIASCDIYVQSSYEEAQPLAVMEAGILGKPIVSTETVGGRTILNDGEFGILTSISAEGFAQGIETLLLSPERRAALGNRYSAADNLKEKQAFAQSWDRLLSE